MIKVILFIITILMEEEDIKIYSVLDSSKDKRYLERDVWYLSSRIMVTSDLRDVTSDDQNFSDPFILIEGLNETGEVQVIKIIPDKDNKPIIVINKTITNADEFLETYDLIFENLDSNKGCKLVGQSVYMTRFEIDNILSNVKTE